MTRIFLAASQLRLYTVGAVITKRFLISCLCALFVITLSALGAAPAIGIATASGHFTVEKSQVWGNTTLFDGASVETQQASSELALRSGVKLQLGAMSRAKVWENRLALERGVGQAFGPSAFEVDAAGLKIHSAEGTARFRVALNDRLEVTALAGVARVVNSSGVVLASIPAGRAMSFAMQQGSATGAITRTGCLLYKDGHYILSGRKHAGSGGVERSGRSGSRAAGEYGQSRGSGRNCGCDEAGGEHRDFAAQCRDRYREIAGRVPERGGWVECADRCTGERSRAGKHSRSRQDSSGGFERRWWNVDRREGCAYRSDRWGRRGSSDCSCGPQELDQPIAGFYNEECPKPHRHSSNRTKTVSSLS